MLNKVSKSEIESVVMQGMQAALGEVKLKVEPASDGVVISLVIPKKLELMTSLILLGSADSLTEYFAKETVEAFTKQLMNAFAGKHSDEKGNPIAE